MTDDNLSLKPRWDTGKKKLSQNSKKHKTFHIFKHEKPIAISKDVITSSKKSE